MEDMNEILFHFEKEGGNQRPDHYMQKFCSAIEDCELSDCGYVGENLCGIEEESERYSIVLWRMSR